jgi:hypothetical protein
MRNVMIVLGLAVMTVSGCAEPRGWRFTPNTYEPPAKPLFMMTVAVPRFRDSRPNENTNKLSFYAIPFMPFGWANVSAPESFSPRFKYRPTDDLAKAAAEEIQATGLFKEAFFTERESEGDLILRGEIKSTHFNQKVLSYGLSEFGSLLWLVGAPVGTVTNELNVRLSVEHKTTNTVLWQNEYKREYHGIMWVYSMPPAFQYDILYTEILKTAMKEMSSQLQRDKSLLASM